MKTRKSAIIVIGGTKGVGSTVAKCLTSQASTVFVVGRTKPKSAHKKIRWIEGSLSSRKQLIPRIAMAIKDHTLIGIAFFQKFRGADEWDGEMDVSLKATDEIINALSPIMPAGAAIVIAGSSAATHIAEEQPVSYHVAKAGLVHLGKYYAATLGRQGIRVNIVSFPAIIKPESANFYSEEDTLREVYEKITPLGRMGTSEDIGSVVRFLMSNDSLFVTGQHLAVDGGMTVLSHELIGRSLAGLSKMKVTQKGKR